MASAASARPTTALLGWNPLIFRLWYLFGAILVAAWLGQGTVYLLVRRRWANVLMVILAAGLALWRLPRLHGRAGPRPDDGQRAHRQRVERHAIVTPGVRMLTPFFNLYGTVTLVGGAL